jgi:hypothetical protein
MVVPSGYSTRSLSSVLISIHRYIYIRHTSVVRKETCAEGEDRGSIANEEDVDEHRFSRGHSWASQRAVSGFRWPTAPKGWQIGPTCSTNTHRIFSPAFWIFLLSRAMGHSGQHHVSGATCQQRGQQRASPSRLVLSQTSPPGSPWSEWGRGGGPECSLFQTSDRSNMLDQHTSHIFAIFLDLRIRGYCQ